MRLAFAACVLVTALSSSIASARPLTIGAGLGSFQAAKDAEAHVGGSGTLGAFGRIGLTRRLGAQLELQKVDQDGSITVRRLAALAVLELGDAKGRLVPLVLAGVGTDRASTDYSQQEGQFAEAGLGLEYRIDGGLVLGADFRIGERSATQQGDMIAYPANTKVLYDVPAGAALFSDGTYRSVRVGMGIRF